MRCCRSCCIRTRATFARARARSSERFLYAALSTVVCQGDNGKWQANVSNVLGNYISGAISNSYYPANERGVALTLENGTSVTLFGALGGQILEFGPDLARLVHRREGAAPAGLRRRLRLRRLRLPRCPRCARLLPLTERCTISGFEVTLARPALASAAGTP